MNHSTPGLPVHHQLRSSLKHMSVKSVMPSSHLILCCPLFLLPSVPSSIRVFSNESTLCMRWPRYWSFSFSIILSKEHLGLISLEWTGWISLQSKRLWTMWITINCGKFWKRWEYQTAWPTSWETYMQVRKQQLEQDMEHQTCSNRKRSTSRLYVVTLLI